MDEPSSTEQAEPEAAEEAAEVAASEPQAPDAGGAAESAAPEPQAPEAGAEESAETDPRERLERERDEYLELAQRARAEFENFRKRSARSVEEAERRGKTSVAKGLVPAVDNLERALQAAGVELVSDGEPGSADPLSREVSAHEALAAGVALVHGEIVGALRAAGVESFDPAGQRFDPGLHEALSTRPATDGEEAGHVVETLQRGYSLGEVLIRPARVVVTS